MISLTIRKSKPAPQPEPEPAPITSLDEFRARLSTQTTHIASTLQAYAAAERAGISRSDFARWYPKLTQTIHEESETQ